MVSKNSPSLLIHTEYSVRDEVIIGILNHSLKVGDRISSYVRPNLNNLFLIKSRNVEVKLKTLDTVWVIRSIRYELSGRLDLECHEVNLAMHTLKQGVYIIRDNVENLIELRNRSCVSR